MSNAGLNHGGTASEQDHVTLTILDVSREIAEMQDLLKGLYELQGRRERQPFGVADRPHPGPLPQERGQTLAAPAAKQSPRVAGARKSKGGKDL